LGKNLKRPTDLSLYISSPSVLILDEPTTGLDFASAFGVVQLLHGMATEDGHTVVCVIHAPSSQIWDMFGKVAFISQVCLIVLVFQKNIG
jgi:ABC-type multidrug transport system ATPase subunit